MRQMLLLLRKPAALLAVIHRENETIMTQLQWLLDPDADLIEVFSHPLSRYLERWTGRPDVLPLPGAGN